MGAWWTSSSSSIGNGEVVYAGQESKAKMYEQKEKRKTFKLMIIAAYIFSVSLAAITLSLFYLFIYNPGKPAHSLGSNGSPHGKHFGKNNEGVVPMNNNYSNYEREEPRALPLEIIQKQANAKKHNNKMDEKAKGAVIKNDKPRLVIEKNLFLIQIAKSVSIIN